MKYSFHSYHQWLLYINKIDSAVTVQTILRSQVRIQMADSATFATTAACPFRASDQTSLRFTGMDGKYCSGTFG